MTSSALSTEARSENGSDARSTLPASIFEKSRMSLMIVSRASPDVRIVSAKSRCSASSSVSRSRPLIPMTAFIGVRISWLIAARNALFAWLAPSAAVGRLLGLGEEPGVLERDRGLPGEADEEVEVGLAERLAARSARRPRRR